MSEPPRPDRPRRSRRPCWARALLLLGGLAAWAGFAWIAVTIEVGHPAHAVRHGGDLGLWLALATLLVLGMVLAALALSGIRRPKRRTTPVSGMDVVGPLTAHPRSVPRAQNWRTADRQPP